MKMHPYLTLIEKRIPLVFDGAVGTEIQKRSVDPKVYGSSAGCNEILNINCPDVLISIHKAYLDAGAHIIQTNTFGGTRVKLGEYGLEKRVHEINFSAANNARRAIDQCSFSDGIQRFVCGSLGPTGYLPSSKNADLVGADYDQLVDIYKEQASALIDGGVDFVRIETSQDLLEVRAAMEGIRSVDKKIPVQVQITIDINGHMLLGSGIESFLGAVIGLGAAVVGINCGMGPKEMTPSILKLLRHSPVPVIALPNAGMPQNIDGKAFYALEPQGFAEILEPLVTVHGLSVVGGCCGTTPAHIKAAADILKDKKVAYRELHRPSCWLSTGIHGIDLESIERPVIIGERLNAQGSKKTKELILNDNKEELFLVAQEQADSGCAVIDICVAVNEKDNEKETLKNLVWYFSDRSSTPFCIDTTDPSVMVDTLKINPGSVMINSINLEHSAVNARKTLSLAAQFGSPVVALTIDDEGMAKTVAKKVELAGKLRDIACSEFGLPEHYIYIDPLVFTLATGEKEAANAANESLEALRQIKKTMPGVRTVMGVSNVSFGLKPKARRILNNVMLYHAVKAGLDAAIFNPLHKDNVENYDTGLRTLAENLLFNRSDDALSDYVNYFEKLTVEKVDGSENVLHILSDEEKIKCAILKRDRRDLQKTIQSLLKTKKANEILNTILLPAMAEVGEKMTNGEMILPFVLQAAEVMKESVTILEPYLKGSNAASKGKIILATVYGDVHDIGKNLVGSILRNQGYAVIDLGKQVAIETILESVKKEKPDAVGLSALLVTTSKQMRLCVEAFAKEGINIPVFIGGAAVNKDFAQRIAILDDKVYEGGVFYARDAFDASRMLDELASGRIVSGKTDSAGKPQSVAVTCEHTAVELTYEAPTEPPFWGTGEMLVWDVNQLLSSINTERLFKAQWAGGKLDSKEYDEVVEKEFLPSFNTLRDEIIENDLIDARGYYSFFPVIAENNRVIMLDPGNFNEEIASFVFPRMPKKNNRSIADYLRPEGDILGVQIVTIGKKIGDYCRNLFQKEDKYNKGYLLNGIGNYLVESLADKVTVEIRKALVIDSKRGRRYSFGYPGLPSLEDQKKLFEIIAGEERLGIILTDGFQMDPEHSTLGVFVCHPDAEYMS
ncbi:MAG: dihydropteroate synthase [Fibrobacter sp.]|nr:dihydropteroate synthase [Fibrobacter sp.]